MTRKALGRGLNALLGEDTGPAAAPASSLEQIPVGLIDPSPFQPRRTMPEQELKELAQSIQSTGVVQPVLLRKAGERYQLVAGERRWRAATLAKLETVPAIVRELADRDALEVALAENILREDLSAIEAAHAFQALNERFGYTHEEIAARLGMDRSSVTNTLRLLRLPESVQQLIDKKMLSSGHARALLACPSVDDQFELAKRILDHDLSVREAERLAMLANRPQKKPETGKAQASAKQDPNIRAATLELERTLGAKVRIVGDNRRGRIEISYYSAEDLNRLYERIARPPETSN